MCLAVLGALFGLIAVVSNALGSDEAVVEMINVFDVGIKYVVSGCSSKDQVVFEISSEELKAASNERVDNQDLINMLLAESNDEMTMDMGFGMMMARIYIEVCFIADLHKTVFLWRSALSGTFNDLVCNSMGYLLG